MRLLTGTALLQRIGPWRSERRPPPLKTVVLKIYNLATYRCGYLLKHVTFSETFKLKNCIFDVKIISIK